VPALHALEPERATLHGHFSRDLAPVLEIDSGDTVRFRTLDVAWGLESFAALLEGRERRTFPGRVSPQDDGHALVGPVAIRGARAGMTLEIAIGALVPGASAAASRAGVRARLTTGWGSRPRAASTRGTSTATRSRAATSTATSSRCGRSWASSASRPTRSSLGTRVASRPAEPGVLSTVPPRPCGGNIDCRELVAGSTLWLPIEVDGALLSTGDGHAAQGDGEVSGTAIECPMDRVDLTLTLRDDLPLATPLARTPAGWIAMGFHEDLDEAALIALEAIVDLIAREHGLGRADALALASVAVDLRVTQIVNQVKGVHALLAHDAVR
jgi:acetamidase/formamidase